MRAYVAVKHILEPAEGEVTALALLTDRVINNGALCEVRREHVVAQNVLDDPVGIVQSLNFAPLRLEHGKMIVTAKLEGAVLQFYVHVVQIAEHCILEPHKWLFIALGKPSPHMRLIQRFVCKYFIELLVYHK